MTVSGQSVADADPDADADADPDADPDPDADADADADADPDTDADPDADADPDPESEPDAVVEPDVDTTAADPDAEPDVGALSFFVQPTSAAHVATTNARCFIARAYCDARITRARSCNVSSRIRFEPAAHSLRSVRGRTKFRRGFG